MKDIFGKILKEYLKTNQALYTIRRDDNFIDKKQNAKIYFTQYPKWKKSEKEILKYAHGKILDIGAGSGRHSLFRLAEYPKSCFGELIATNGSN